MRFQNRLISINGPNVAPNPAHAKLTIVKMTLFSSIAMKIAITVMARSVMREINNTCLSVALRCKRP